MKKKLNVLLIFAVIALWGTAGYKYIDRFFNEKKTINEHSDKSLAVNKMIIKRDTFQLRPLARDPFLNKLSTRHNAVINKKKSVQKKAINNSKFISDAMSQEWPDIKYFGYIKSASNTEVVLIKVNQVLFKMHKGDTKDNLTILNIYKDSVSVKFNKEKRIFAHSIQ